MSWTDERVELLKKLWSDGLSASQIAAELGGITRNAVIGKVHRLGLSGRAKSASSASPRPRKARTSTHMLRIGRGSIRGSERVSGLDGLGTPAGYRLMNFSQISQAIALYADSGLAVCSSSNQCRNSPMHNAANVVRASGAFELGNDSAHF